jgi:hypothetical protein
MTSSFTAGGTGGGGMPGAARGAPQEGASLDLSTNP